MPIKGQVLVQEGAEVEPNQVVAQAKLPGLLQTIKLAEKLGVEAREVPKFFQLEKGATITKGQTVAETKGFFGLFRTLVESDYDGTVEEISEISGHILIREAPIPVDMEAYIKGRVSRVIPEEGAVIETRCAMVQGIFGVGGERQGVMRTATPDSHTLLEADLITEADAGKILVGGSGVTLEAMEKAGQIGVLGLVVGAIRDVDLTQYLGYDIGVAITGSENIPFTMVVTEGFGKLDMADRTFDLLKSLDGQSASINGATQIRAGVIRPEVIIPIAVPEGHVEVEPQAMVLEPGTMIRMIREPFFGEIGEVTGLPSTLQKVESGAEVRVLKARLGDGREVTVPRANVEIIARK